MEVHDPKRRTVLRGALAAGVTLVICGCNSREQENTAAPNTDQSSMNSGSPMAETTQSNKMSQEQARYQDKPNGNQRCGSCANFFAESGTCRIIEGQISPESWCIAWTSA
jgi:hypothetical protein